MFAREEQHLKGASLDFLRELFFVLRNVPALAHRYKRQSFFAVASLVLSAGSTLVKNGLFTEDSTTHAVLKWIAWAGMGLTAMLFCLAFIDIIKNRLSFNDLVSTSVSLDAYYHPLDEETYELVQCQHCINRTHMPVRNFAEISDGYYDDISSCTLDYRFDTTARTELVALTSSCEPRWDNFGSRRLYVYRNTMEFSPPLQSSAGFDLIWKIIAKGGGVEAAAFDKGTTFYRGVDYDTLQFYLTIHAPAGYEVCLLDWGVCDSSGSKLTEETGDQEKPQTAPSGALLQWRVSLARKHLRYMLRYRFDAHSWTRAGNSNPR